MDVSICFQSYSNNMHFKNDLNLKFQFTIICQGVNLLYILPMNSTLITFPTQCQKQSLTK